VPPIIVRISKQQTQRNSGGVLPLCPSTQFTRGELSVALCPLKQRDKYRAGVVENASSVPFTPEELWMGLFPSSAVLAG
jgi:hypothetical protein